MVLLVINDFEVLGNFVIEEEENVFYNMEKFLIKAGYLID